MAKNKSSWITIESNKNKALDRQDSSKSCRQRGQLPTQMARTATTRRGDNQDPREDDSQSIFNNETQKATLVAGNVQSVSKKKYNGLVKHYNELLKVTFPGVRSESRECHDFSCGA
jgi:phosphatidate phosphatase PAH1